MYSQHEEEEHILHAVANLGADGRVLDIGAWDPKRFSNSRALIELGWTAVLIEPSPRPLDALVVEYGNNPKVTVCSAAVGLEHGWADMRISADAVSSSETRVLEQWKDAGGYYGSLVVPTITLADI